MRLAHNSLFNEASKQYECPICGAWVTDNPLNGPFGIRVGEYEGLENVTINPLTWFRKLSIVWQARDPHPIVKDGYFGDKGGRIGRV